MEEGVTEEEGAIEEENEAEVKVVGLRCSWCSLMVAAATVATVSHGVGRNSREFCLSGIVTVVKGLQ